MSDQPSFVIRGLWFIFVGWWLTGLWLSAAWLLNVTVIGLPLGIKLINKVPLVLSLKRRENLVEEGQGGSQYSLVVRGLWFLFIGWWASGVWTGIAYVFTVSIVGIPLAVWMYDRLPFVVSLYRY